MSCERMDSVDGNLILYNSSRSCPLSMWLATKSTNHPRYRSWSSLTSRLLPYTPHYVGHDSTSGNITAVQSWNSFFRWTMNETSVRIPWLERPSKWIRRRSNMCSNFLAVSLWASTSVPDSIEALQAPRHSRSTARARKIINLHHIATTHHPFNAWSKQPHPIGL